MNSKVWLIVFGVFSALIIGGTGFFAFSKYKVYAEADSGWNQKVGTIESLESRVPYPNEENELEIKKRAADYDVAVKGLYESLNTFQKPLNEELENTAFQQLVKERVEEFRKFSQAGGMEIKTTKEFQLGFERYSANLPPPEMVSILDFELDAINNLLRELVTAGATSMETFDRDLIPGEIPGTEPGLEGVVNKYPVRIRFVAPHDSFQTFINKIANDKSYFYIVRVLKVKNQVTEGSPKLIADDGGAFPVFENLETKMVAPYETLLEWGYGTESDEVVQEKAKAEGYAPASKDARVIMGQEQLEIFMIVDIARFVNPDDVVIKEVEDDRKKTRKR